MIQSPIIVTEIPRSGCDVLALALAASGVRIGDGGNKDQEAYRFANRDILHTLVRPMLRGMHSDIRGVIQFPDLKLCWDIAPLTASQWRSRIADVLKSQGYSGGPWAYVGADAAMLFPVWVEAFPDSTWVIVRRDRHAILESCEQTKFFNRDYDHKTLSTWCARYEERFTAIGNAAGVHEIWPSKFIQGDFSALKHLITELGLEWNETAVRDALTPILWGNGVFESKEVS